MPPVSCVLQPPKLASLTRENVMSATQECHDLSLPNTSRSEWSVDSVGRGEVLQHCLSLSPSLYISVCLVFYYYI